MDQTSYFQQPSLETQISTKVFENFAKEVLEKDLRNVKENNQLYSSDKIKSYVQIVTRFRKNLSRLFAQFKTKIKQITIGSNDKQKLDNLTQYIQQRYTDDTVQNSFDNLRRNFYNFIMVSGDKKITAISEELHQSKTIQIQTLIIKSSMKSIQIIINQLENDETTSYHVLLRALLIQRIQKNLQKNFKYLQINIEDYEYGQQSKSIKHLFRSIKRQFKQFGIAFLTLANSYFYNFTFDEGITQLNNEIKKLLEVQNLQNMKKARPAMVKLYKMHQEIIIKDVCNNLGNTFRRQYIKKLIEDKQKFKKALNEVQFFKYRFSFQTNSQVFVKNYKFWWRGKQQSENRIMYNKHWSFINYLILTSPSGIVQYSTATEEQPGRCMKFVMEKGSVAFNNFESGYRYFHQLKVKQKIRLILDLVESLIVLEQHGINHYDITIRNCVKANNKWKLIDFDVARMVDVDFDFSEYDYQDVEEIKKWRSEIIKQSQALIKKELREEKIISKTNKEKPTTPIENINRLAEYFSLINQIQLLNIIKDNTFRQKFTKQQRFAIICEYEKYIVGKRDCNKFGLMLLKLFYKEKEKMFQQYMSVRVQQFLKQFRRQGKDMNFSKYAEYFELDNDVATLVNAELLRLISGLLIHEVKMRVPMRLFYLQLIKLFQIKQYPIIIKPQKPKQSLARRYNGDMINIYGLLSPINEYRRDQIAFLQKIFKQTARYGLQHYEECMNIHKYLSPSLGNSERLTIGSFDKKQQLKVEQFISIMKKRQKSFLQQMKLIWNKLKQRRNEMECFKHGFQIQAQCLQPGCSSKWLCYLCLKEVYCGAKKSEIHIKKIQTSPIKKLIMHHKFSHYHQPFQRNKEIICLIKIQDKILFQCKECHENIEDIGQLDQIYLLNNSSNQIYQKINLSEKKDDYKYLISKSTPRRNIKEYMQIEYSTIYENFKKHEILNNDQLEKLFGLLLQSKRYISRWLSNIGQLNKEILQRLYSKNLFQFILDELQFLQNEPNLLKQLRKMQQSDLTEYILRFKLQKVAKINIQQRDSVILNHCQYFLDQVQQALQSLSKQLDETIHYCNIDRINYTITNRNIFYDFKLTHPVRQFTKVKLQKQLVPFPKTIMRNLKRQNKQKSKQLDEIVLTSKVSVFSQSSFYEKSRISIKNQVQSFKQKKDYQRCPCKENESTSPRKKIGKSYKIFAICTLKTCKKRFICNECKDSHQCPQQQYFHFRNISPQEQHLKQIEYFKSYIAQLKVHLRIQKSLQRIVSDVKAQMVSQINFIDQLLANIKHFDKLKKTLLQHLSDAVLEQNHKKFSDSIWLTSKFAQNPLLFMEVLFFATQRYVYQLNQARKKIKQIYDLMSRTNFQQNMFSLQNFQQISEQWFNQKYKQIINTHEKDTPMPFQYIFDHNKVRVKQLIIHHIKRLTNTEHITKKPIHQQLQQLKIKLIRNHYNHFDINLYWSNFKQQINNILQNIQKFKKLKILIIQDTPNWENPIVFRSIEIKSVLNQVEQLKQIKLECLNSFDKACLDLLNKKHKNCLLSIESYSDQVTEYIWMKQLFEFSSQLKQPFKLYGEMFSPCVNENIKKGQFQLMFSNYKYKDTMQKLKLISPKIANKLCIKVNQLRQHTQADDGFSYFEARKNFWCRNTFGHSHTKNLIQKINKRYEEVIKIFYPIQQKFFNIRYLKLYGILINGEQKQNPDAKQLQCKIKQFLISLKALQTLQIVKCFGLDLSILVQNRISLKKLIIEQSVFKAEQINKQLYSFQQLQTMILKRVGLFQISKNKLTSKELANQLEKFDVKNTINHLVLNEFYELQTQSLKWIKQSLLKRLSLKRCFRINTEIHQIIRQISTLQGLDITSTGIDQSRLNEKLTNKSKNNVRQKLKIHNFQVSLLDIKMTLNNIIILKEISRMANVYHIPELQKAINSDSQRKLPLNYLEINSITFKGLKIREMNQYYPLKVFALFPDIQIVTIDDCQWQGSKKSQRYNEFPFIERLKKLKQLSLIKADIVDLRKCCINQYKFLRKLVLSHNYMLNNVQNLYLGQLRELDLSNCDLQVLKIDPQTLKNLQKINLQHTNLKQIPSNLLKFTQLRIIIASMKFSNEQNEKNEIKNKHLNYHDQYLNQKLIYYQNDIIDKRNMDIKVEDLSTALQKVKQMDQFKKKWKKIEQTNLLTDSIIEKIFYVRSCLVFSQQWKQSLRQKHQQYCMHLIDYEIFKIQQDIKGIQDYKWFDNYCKKIKNQKQYTHIFVYNEAQQLANHPLL